MDTLEAIIHYGLSVRQIPKVRRIIRSISGPADEVIETALDMSKWNFDPFYKANRDNPNYRFDTENKKIYRLYAVENKVPAHAGYWMCKQVPNTDSKVQWNIKEDNLAPTLAESVSRFLSIGDRQNGNS